MPSRSTTTAAATAMAATSMMPLGYSYVSSGGSSSSSHMTTDDDSTTTTTTTASVLLTAATGLAACGVVALVALQSDYVSRYILSPERLALKRRLQYQHEWQQLLGERCALQIAYARVGGNISNYQPNDELVQTTFLDTPEKIKEFLKNQVFLGAGASSNKKTARTTAAALPCLQIGRIGPDFRQTSSPEVAEATMRNIRLEECFVWLYREYSDSTTTKESEIYQSPLILFAQVASEVMENHITTTTLAFVADASANASSDLLLDMVQASKLPLAIVQQPLWMACMAWLAAGKATTTASPSSTHTLERAMFALCRLQALETIRTTTTSTASTVLFTLPGQASTAALLPFLVQAFPDDRHVFAYTGCLETVAHARRTIKRQQPGGGGRPNAGSIPKTLSAALSFKGDATKNSSASTTTTTTTTTWTTPLSQSLRELEQSAWISHTPQLHAALSALALQDARVVQTWMTSVHTCLHAQSMATEATAAAAAAAKRKNKKKKALTTEFTVDPNHPLASYRPYVFRSDYISNPNTAKSFRPMLVMKNRPQQQQASSSSNNNNNQQQQQKHQAVYEISKYSDRYWSARSLLQFITGRQSQELSTETMDAVMSLLQERDDTMTASDGGGLSPELERIIENVVFQHKRILIASKTLPDTVQPAQHWTLKQAARAGGCSCCAPEPEEDDDDDDDDFDPADGDEKDETEGGDAVLVARPKKTMGYVDGSVGFAFDPSKFA